MSAEQTPDIERVLAETLTLAVMHYYGFTDEDIAAAEQVHPGRVCDEDECFDEDGTSVHGQAWVELGATANTVIEAVLPALAPVLAAAVREAKVRELREAADDLPKRTCQELQQWASWSGPVARVVMAARLRALADLIDTEGAGDE